MIDREGRGDPAISAYCGLQRGTTCQSAAPDPGRPDMQQSSIAAVPRLETVNGQQTAYKSHGSVSMLHHMSSGWIGQDPAENTAEPTAP